MKTWDDWSDFEVNKAVAMQIGLTISDAQSASLKSKSNSVLCDDISSSFEVNYCNNWADMGSLLLKSNIVITPCMGINIGDATGYFDHKNPITHDFDDDSKALRAAAIVFLMMNGVRP